jgi:hypothetical protein
MDIGKARMEELYEPLGKLTTLGQFDGVESFEQD